MSAPLWTPEELVSVTKGRWLVAPPAMASWAPSVVHYNLVKGSSRGAIIVCMNPRTWGQQRPDTSRRLAEWAKGGASCGIVDATQAQALGALGARFPILVVDDTRVALRELGAASRARFRGQVFAVTGTVGKTTSRAMIRHIFAARGATATGGNNNNIPGVQKTLACTPEGHAACVIEMGFGRPVDGIEISSQQARPHVGLVTTIDYAHLNVLDAASSEGPAALRAIAGHKGGIYGGIDKGGWALSGADHEAVETLERRASAQGLNFLTFGRSREADLRISKELLSPEKSRFSLEGPWGIGAMSLTVIGPHMVANAAGAVAAAVCAGMDFGEACRRMESFAPVQGRSDLHRFAVEGGEATMIDDSFNATPLSVASSLRMLAILGKQGRRVAVLGDIASLGPDAEALHVALAKEVERQRVDALFTHGPLMGAMAAAVSKGAGQVHVHAAKTIAELHDAVRDYLRPGDVLTLKSGRGTGGLGDRVFRALAEGLREGRAEYEGPLYG